MPDDTGGFTRIETGPADTGGFERQPKAGDQGAGKGAAAGGTWAGALWRGLVQGFQVPELPLMPGAQANREKVQAGVQADYQQAQKAHPIAAGIGNFGGQMAATAPLMALPGAAASIPGRIGMGAAAGALGGAAQPVGGGDYWTEKARQVGIGAAAGGALGGAGRVIGPPLSQAAQDAISKFPHIAGIIRGTAMRTPDNFNRGAVNQALDPIGVVIPKSVKAGHELINAASDALTDAFNAVLPKLTLNVNPQYLPQGMALIRAAGNDIVIPEQQKAFENFVTKFIEQPLQKSGGTLDGQAIKRIESVIGRKASSFVGSADAGQRELGEALYAARDTFMGEVARQNPAAASELNRVNQAYAMFARVRAAASRKADSEGVFTPQDLLVASRSADKSPGKGSFAKGDAAMQAVGEATRGPMSVSKVNRILTEILGGAAGAAAGGPVGGVVGTVAGAATPEIAKGIVRSTQNPIARVGGAAVSASAPAAGAGAANAIRRTNKNHKTEPPP